MTDRPKLELDLAALRQTEITLRQILDNSTTVRVFAKDLDGRYLFVNRAFEQHVGLPQREIVGRTTADIAPAEIAAGLRANDRRVIETGRPIEVEETKSSGASGARCSRTNSRCSVPTAGRTPSAASRSTSPSASVSPRPCTRRRSRCRSRAANGCSRSSRARSPRRSASTR